MMEEPLDLAQYAAEKRNDPWFGLGNMLTGNVAGNASGTLTLADIEALKERMFDSELQAETTTSNAESPPPTVESLEAIFKQFPPMDVPLPPVDFANVFNYTFTPELSRSTLPASMFSHHTASHSMGRACISPSRGVNALASSLGTGKPLGRVYRGVQPTPTKRLVRPSPHQGRKLQVELAAKPLGFVPILACRTLWPMWVYPHHKQFLIVERSAFALACSYIYTFLLYALKVAIAPAGDFVSSRVMNGAGLHKGVVMR